MEYPSRVIYRKRFAENGVKYTVDQQLTKVEKRGNRLLATFRHELTGKTMQLEAAEVIVECGTEPVADVFEQMKAASINGGITDNDALLALKPQVKRPASPGAFELHRIGDAVTSRGIHSAIYDAYRLVLPM